MTQPDPLRHFDNESSLPAWSSEVACAPDMPWLAEALTARRDLLPRVARCREQLLALPRRTRRAWQRQLARSSDLATVLADWSHRPSARAVQRQLARSVAGAALLLALVQGAALAATIVVDTTVPGINPGDGKCSVIEAIDNANGGAVHADCTAGDLGPNTIVLPRGTITLSAINNTTYEATGLPVITSEVVVQGNDTKLTRKGSAPPFRLIAVGASGDLTLDNLTLTGGSGNHGGAVHNDRGVLTIMNSTISGNDVAFTGAGVSSYYGTLTINNSTISGNEAAYIGGGITSVYTALTIDQSTISGNTVGKRTVGGAAGAIYAEGGTVDITNSTISGNRGIGELVNFGGAISGAYTVITIDNSTIERNKVGGTYFAGGGGIVTYYADLTVTNSTISGNQATGKAASYGGAIHHTGGGALNVRNSTISKNKAGGAYGAGGGISNHGLATIQNSTLSGNSASGKHGYGGGIFNYDGGVLTITNSTITGNKAGSQGYGGGIENFGDLTLHTTLISGNKAGLGGAEVDNTGPGTVTANDFNLFGADGSPGVLGFVPGVQDVVPLPRVRIGNILGGLANNGGPTKTHALKSDSPAVNAVPNANPACTGTDQRGLPRPSVPGGNCDIGAFELQ